MHAFTNLLYQQLANDVSNLSLFAVNHAVDERRHRLSTCVNAEGGQLEHCL